MSVDSLFIYSYSVHVRMNKMEKQKKTDVKRSQKRIIDMLSSLNEGELQAIQNILVTSLIVHEASKELQKNVYSHNGGEFLN
jgi:hypothetical protein